MRQYKHMNFVKTYYGSALLWTIALFPVLLWLTNTNLSTLTDTPGAFIASGGKFAALAGMTLYVFMPVLSMRHKLLEVLFGGMDRLYKLHTTSGKVSVLLILLHPILLGGGRLIGDKTFTTIWSWTSFEILIGIVGLLGMIIVTAVSIYSHIKHQTWVLVHRIFGVLIPVFYIHALLAGSQVAVNPALRYYLIAVGIVGIAAFLYRSVFGSWLVKKHRYTLVEANRFTDTVVELVLKPTGVPIRFQPGQYAYISFLDGSVDPEAHPFSFSNANNGPYIRFTVKSLGDDTKDFHNLQTGTKALVEGPYGTFSYKRVKNYKQVWIAGGVGITPFLSMARSFTTKQPHDIRFFYGTESLHEAVFLQEFIDVSRHLPKNFKTQVVAKNMSGFITINMLKDQLSRLNEFDYMICGPPSMMKVLATDLREAGVPADQIHSEVFSM